METIGKLLKIPRAPPHNPVGKAPLAASSKNPTLYLIPPRPKPWTLIPTLDTLKPLTLKLQTQNPAHRTLIPKPTPSTLNRTLNPKTPNHRA